MPYLNNIITADAGCSTSDKGYSPFGQGVQQCYSTLIAIPLGKPGSSKISMHPSEYQRLKGLGVFNVNQPAVADGGMPSSMSGWFICTNGIKNHLILETGEILQSFASGFQSTYTPGVGGVEVNKFRTNIQISATTAANAIYVTGIYKGNASTAYDIPACICKCPITNCCPTEKWPNGGVDGMDPNDFQLSCDQNNNSYSPLRSGCF